MTNKQAALMIIRTLRRKGFEALLAGGCVRDMLLGRRAKDYDIATSARPAEISCLFRRTLKVGAKFGVVIVLVENRQFEVATFRSDHGYFDGRHPVNVRFSTAAEDAERRDFTINGMFYDPIGRKIIDYVGGKQDLDRRLIRTIGKADRRFGEDYLRMLRAVRFSTQLCFTIEPATRAAIRRRAACISKISGERIRAEIESVLVDPRRAEGVRLMGRVGLLGVIFGCLENDKAPLAARVPSCLKKNVDFMLALAALFASNPTDDAMLQCEVLRLSRRQSGHLKFLLSNRGRLLDEAMRLGELKLLLGGAYFWDLYELQKAIEKAVDNRANLARLARLRRWINEICDTELRPRPLLNGHDLMRLGVVPGPELGHLAEEMYIAQLESAITTTKQAEKWVLDRLAERGRQEK